jgi:transcription elongation factor SPT6
VSQIELADPEVGRVFMSSARSQLEFKEYPKGIRQAVSTGRRALDPVSELSYMHFEDSDHGDRDNLGSNDLLSLNLHALQHSIPNEQLMRGLRRQLIRVVNTVGVDINKIIGRPFLHGPLQFVAGLGPRKAKSLLDQLQSRGFVPSRVALKQRSKAAELDDDDDGHSEVKGPQTVGYLGNVVWHNCVGFLRIHGNAAMKENAAISEAKESSASPLLDSTRIHPESYELAEQVIRDALGEELPDLNVEDEDEKTRLREIMTTLTERLMQTDEIKKLNELDLVAFAQMEEKEGKGKKVDTLLLIERELRSPFGAPEIFQVRTPLSSKDVFELITGESDRTLRVGQLVTPVVKSIVRSGGGVNCALDGELSGFLPASKLQDQTPREWKEWSPAEKVEWLSARVRVGSIKQCRILSINYDRFLVDLTARKPDLEDDSKIVEYANKVGGRWLEWRETDDDRKLLAAANAIVTAAASGAGSGVSSLLTRSAPPPFEPRAIDHVMFKNVTRTEAQNKLIESPVERAMFRPSSKGVSHLSLTIKAVDQQGAHKFFEVDIVEGNKANPRELGTPLTIANEQYEDLDHIVAAYVEPVLKYAQAVMNALKFRLAETPEVHLTPPSNFSWYVSSSLLLVVQYSKWMKSYVKIKQAVVAYLIVWHLVIPIQVYLNFVGYQRTMSNVYDLRQHQKVWHLTNNSLLLLRN